MPLPPSEVPPPLFMLKLAENAVGFSAPWPENCTQPVWLAVVCVSSSAPELNRALPLMKAPSGRVPLLASEVDIRVWGATL